MIPFALIVKDVEQDKRLKKYVIGMLLVSAIPMTFTYVVLFQKEPLSQAALNGVVLIHFFMQLFIYLMARSVLVCVKARLAESELLLPLKESVLV